jgi:hypothetical protein
MLSQIYGLARLLNASHRVMRAVLRWLGLLFGWIPKSGKLSPFTYRCIHYGFIVAVTVILAWYSPRLVPEARVPISNWFVQRFYVAIQFVLFYLFVRLMIAGIQLFFAKDLSDFEDIDRAWEAGLDALAREGFDLQWLPIFLINGAGPEQLKSLIASARFQWKVKGNEDDPRLGALSFYACDEALFLCLNDVGAMSRQLKAATARVKSDAPSITDAAGHATLRPGQLQAALQQTRRPEKVQSTGGKTLAPGAVAAGVTMPPPQARYGETIRPGELEKVTTALPLAPRHVAHEKLSQDDLRSSRKRLEYVCQRLIAERGSYCPVNGLLQIIPLQWTQSTAYEPMFNAVAQDLKTLHDGLHLQFPVVCLHSGLEDVTGIAQFIERGKELDSRFRDSRAGSRYPAGLAVDDETGNWVAERGLQWFRDWVYAEFAKNLTSPQNRQLYQFLCSLSTRRNRLARELTMIATEAPLMRLTGCYFAATGSEPSRQGFVHGVIQRLMSEQNDVAWIPAWRARDSRLLWLTLTICILVLGILAADIYLVWRIWVQASAAAMN